MLEEIKDMQSKGLIEIIRKPRSEKLTALIMSTKTYPASSCWLYWLEWGNINKN